MSALNKVKAKLTEIKDQIDLADEREIEAKHELKDALERLQKAEEERDSYKRRIALLHTNLSKVQNQVDEKQNVLDSIEGNLHQTHSHTRRLEDLEIEGDEMIGKLEMELQVHLRKQEEAENLAESFERKLAHSTLEYNRAVQRYKEGEMNVADLEMTFETISSQLKKLEERDTEATDREDEMDEKTKYLESLIKERTDHVEEVCRKIGTLERLLDERVDESEKVHSDLQKVEKEMQNIEQIALDEESW